MGTAADDSSLRVLYSFPHPLGSPGIGTTAWHQVDELARAGHRVQVVTTRVAVPPAAGVRVRSTLPGEPGRALGRLLGLDRVMALNDLVTARLLTASRPAPDVVHTWPAGGLLAIRAADRRGVASVRELPNTHTEHAYSAAQQEADNVGVLLDDHGSHAYHGARLARELLEYAEATALLAPSDPVAESFTVRGFDPHRILRHRYGFDPARFRLSDVRRPEDRPRRPPAVLFVGSVEPRKGLHIALRAWTGSRASAGGTFTVCGRFAPGYREALRPLLDHPGIRIEGFTADPAPLYAAHDVLVLPSVEEGSALVTYEASAMGCVPLVSEAAGAVAVDGVTALVHPTRDWQALRVHLDRLVDEPDLLPRLRRACLDNRDQLTWASGTALTVAAYRDAMALRRAAPHIERRP